MANKRTCKFKKLAVIFTILSVLCTIFPAIFFTIYGLMTSELVVQKTALVGTVFVSVIGSLYCLINKQFTFRSKIWLFLLSLYFALQSIETVIIVFAVTQITDELILSPIAKHFRTKLSINREIDIREENEQ